MFGVSVKSLRARLGISQEELAERADLHRTYISDVERGSRNVSLQNIVRLARALEISVPGLFSQDNQLPSGRTHEPSAAKSGAEGWELVDVLLVEDNPDDVEITLRAFKKSRLVNRVKVVGDGVEALDYLFCRGKYESRNIADQPQLILLDLNLPKLGGMEVLRAVKANGKTRDVRVVILTVSQISWDIDECINLGVDAYIVKPVNFENLSRTTPFLNLHWALINPSEAAAQGEKISLRSDNGKYCGYSG